MSRLCPCDSLFDGVTHEKLLAGDANALAAVLGIDLRNMCLQPVAVALELLVLPLRRGRLLGGHRLFGHDYRIHVHLLRYA